MLPWSCTPTAMSYESAGTGSGANQQPLTGRQLVMIRLGKAVARSTAADLQRACEFLEWAVEIRKGCSKQRAGARKAQYRRRLERAEEYQWKRRFD
jgi:hypothetical protein